MKKEYKEVYYQGILYNNVAEFNEANKNKGTIMTAEQFYNKYPEFYQQNFKEALNDLFSEEYIFVANDDDVNKKIVGFRYYQIFLKDKNNNRIYFDNLKDLEKHFYEKKYNQYEDFNNVLKSLGDKHYYRYSEEGFFIGEASQNDYNNFLNKEVKEKMKEFKRFKKFIVEDNYGKTEFKKPEELEKYFNERQRNGVPFNECDTFTNVVNKLNETGKYDYSDFDYDSDFYTERHKFIVTAVESVNKFEIVEVKEDNEKN